MPASRQRDTVQERSRGEKQRETEQQQALFVERNVQKGLVHRVRERERDSQREEQGLEEGVVDWGPWQHHGQCSVGLPPCLDVQDIQTKPGDPPSTQASQEDHRSVMQADVHLWLAFRFGSTLRPP